MNFSINLPGIDDFDLNARLKPALLVLFPVFLTIYIWYPCQYDPIDIAITVLLLSGIITLIVHLTRSKGLLIGRKLKKEWKEYPSVIMLRHSDDTIDETTKARYHHFLQQNVYGCIMPTPAQEISNKKKADEIYSSALRWLIENTRDKKRFSLLFVENISFGFRQNIFALKTLAIIILFICIILVALKLILNNSTCGLHFGTLFNEKILEKIAVIAFGILLYFWILVVNKNWVKEAADLYAKRLLASCDILI